MISKTKIYEIGFKKFLIFLKVQKRFGKNKILKCCKIFKFERINHYKFL